MHTKNSEDRSHIDAERLCCVFSATSGSSHGGGDVLSADAIQVGPEGFDLVFAGRSWQDARFLNNQPGVVLAFVETVGFDDNADGPTMFKVSPHRSSPDEELRLIGRERYRAGV